VRLELLGRESELWLQTLDQLFGSRHDEGAGEIEATNVTLRFGHPVVHLAMEHGEKLVEDGLAVSSHELSVECELTQLLSDVLERLFLFKRCWG